MGRDPGRNRMIWPSETVTPQCDNSPMGRRPPNEQKILEAKLAGAHARLRDIMSRRATRAEIAAQKDVIISYEEKLTEARNQA